MRRSTRVPSLLSTIGAGISLLLGATVATAQSSPAPAPAVSEANLTSEQPFQVLGDLLDAGGKLMPAQQFSQEIVQRLFVGRLSSGALIEVMYTASGTVVGNLRRGGAGQSVGGESNFGRSFGAPQNWLVSGSWTIDDSERICATLTVNYAQGASMFPKRCQFWFKLGDKYFESDSDEDRSAKLLVRVLKR